MTDNADWQPVRLYGAGLQEHMGREWNCEPAWDIHAVYPEADEYLPHPEKTLAQEDPDGDYPNRDRTMPVFVDRHIDRRFHLDYPRTTKDAPRVRSHTITDPEREWEIVLEHRDRYLADAGLTLDDEPERIAKCLADTFKWRSYFQDKPSCPTFAEGARELTNPIEGLLFQCFCVGCAHAFAALADMAGLACRTIGCGGHRMAEVRTNGQWHMIENTCRHKRNPTLEAFFPASFAEVTLEPLKFRDCMPDQKMTNYWSIPGGQYHFMGGAWQSPPTLRFAASNAYALYPDFEHWRIKAEAGNRLPIILRRNGFYWENSVHSSDAPKAREWQRSNTPFELPEEGRVGDFLYAPFQPGDSLRQSIWLDAVDDMDRLEVAIPLPPTLEIDEALGRGLVVSVGDFEQPLAPASWPAAEPDSRCHFVCTVNIPPAALTANAVNWIEFHNRGEKTVQAPYLPAAMEPYLPPLKRG